MGLDYSYSQPSESEDYGGNTTEHGLQRGGRPYRRDQAEISYKYALARISTLLTEVEFGFPQTCYCGGQPLVATTYTKMIG
ncbi:hypothetical protein Bca52824_078249 [Brassica carinata]|uniref:Uncharacterized protein n=1 Tax=Brassica carinata TaxID=52824 RepID=A0A8X7PXH3_BRACI|nr:hypothetical protein Bca52824_078249 [Brassica carinata]